MARKRDPMTTGQMRLRLEHALAVMSEPRKAVIQSACAILGLWVVCQSGVSITGRGACFF